jgi:Tfp pilus assembly protein FimT
MTLLELMVALVLVGVMIGLGASTLSDWADHQRAATSARGVADAISLARSEAIRTGNQHIVAFDISSGLAGLDADIVIVNDGPLGNLSGVSSNCKIDAGEIIQRVTLEPGVRFGSNATAVAPDDPGTASEALTGTTFKNAANSAASWVMFGADGLPRRFTENVSTTPPCAAMGVPAAAGGAIYLTNDKRDYAVVMTPLGGARVHRYITGADEWTQ